jgi:hypothetical protein
VADDGGSPITGYKVQVLTLDGKQVGANRRAGAAANSLMVRGLTNGTSYRFRVRARNDAGASLWSTTMRMKPHVG